MDFRPAHARAQAERELRWRENWDAESSDAKRAFKLTLLVGFAVLAIVVAVQHLGVPWILPAYIGVGLAYASFRLVRRRRRA